MADMTRRERLAAGFVRFLSFGARALSHGTALAVGRFMGGVFYRFAASRRRIGAENLSYAFPELSQTERDGILKEHFAHLGMNFAELLRFPKWEKTELSRVVLENLSTLDEAVAMGKGVLIVTAHTGNWEILAPLLPTLHPSPMVIAQPLRNAALDRLLTRWRSVTGMEIVPRQGALRRLVAGLKQGRIVGLLADQDAGENGSFVPFFGRLASAEASPVTLARRLRCPFLLCVTFRNADGTHRVRFESIPLLALPTCGEGQGGEDAATLERIYSRLETHIRAAPAQWLWIHRRWKTRPESLPSATESRDTFTKPKVS